MIIKVTMQGLSWPHIVLFRFAAFDLVSLQSLLCLDSGQFQSIHAGHSRIRENSSRADHNIRPHRSDACLRDTSGASP